MYRRSRAERPLSVNKSADHDQAYLRIENLSKVYATHDGEVRALNDVLSLIHISEPTRPY